MKHNLETGYSYYKDLRPEDLPNEVWRQVVGFEKQFMVSNLGRVKSISSTPRIVNQTLDSSGYLKVSLNSRPQIVHRLVAKAFIPNKKQKPIVNHINGVRDNNWISNLEWATHQENTVHGIYRARQGGKAISIIQIHRQSLERKVKKDFYFFVAVTLWCAIMIVPFCYGLFKFLPMVLPNVISFLIAATVTALMAVRFLQNNILVVYYSTLILHRRK